MFGCRPIHRGLLIESVFFLDFVSKLRQGAPACRSLFVDDDTPVSVLHATQTILDFAIDVF